MTTSAIRNLLQRSETRAPVHECIAHPQLPCLPRSTGQSHDLHSTGVWRGAVGACTAAEASAWA